LERDGGKWGYTIMRAKPRKKKRKCKKEKEESAPGAQNGGREKIFMPNMTNELLLDSQCGGRS